MKTFCCLTIVLTAASLAPGCSHNPESFLSQQAQPDRAHTVAIIPFENLSGQQDASKKVEDLFLVELMKTRRYTVVEPGEVERVLVEERIRPTARLPLSALKALAEKLSVDRVLVGTVLEYRMYGSPGGEIPSVAVAARMVDTESGAIVWSSHHSRKGDDAETVFGLGRVTSLETLARMTVQDLVKTLAAK